MLLAVEGGGFFSSSASGYTHGLALLLLGKKAEDTTTKVSPYNHYRIVDHEVEHHLPSCGKDSPQVTCAPFTFFSSSANVINGASPRSNSMKLSKSLSVNQVNSGKEKATHNAWVSENGRKGCLKGSLDRNSSEHCMIASESEDSRESVEELQRCDPGIGRRVQWTDTCGKDLAEIREFEASSEAGLSDDESEHGGLRRCGCVIQ